MQALKIVQHMYPSVTRVADAKKPILIDVTAADATSKAQRNHNACALAVACKRQCGLDGVIIARSTAYLVTGKKATRYRVPDSASREIVAFDRGAKFSPGSYVLTPFPMTQKLGSAHGPSPTKTSPKNKPKYSRFRHVTVGIRTSLISQETM